MNETIAESVGTKRAGQAMALGAQVGRRPKPWPVPGRAWFGMGLTLLAAVLVVVSPAGVSGQAAGSTFAHFITARGDQLVEGDRPFRFVSFNIPNLHLVEDNVPFGEQNPWRLPDRFEITDALESARQAGGTVVRTYVLSVVRTNDAPGAPRHVLGPGRFNEEAFRALDLVLQTANQTGVRIILPFVDNWSWWGGIAEYAGFRGKPRDAFWTDPEVIADFQKTIRFLVTRRNTLTGVRYCDDKAILCWETGNELLSPAPWTRQIAAYIKSLDRQHLVMDGYHSTELREDSLAMPEIDVVTTHHYPGGGRTFAELVRANALRAKGRKPYVVGEFGFVDTPAMAATLDAVVESGAAGALVWSLRFRSRDGGFYWHSEPAGGNKYKAYHWPGFPSGAEYDEANLLALMRRKAFEIRGEPSPALPVPHPPVLLRSSSVAGLYWQGSVGATGYTVERAASRRGPWVVAGDGIDETAVQHRPLFVDEQAAKGAWYYRVRAKNAAGVSAPSKVIGPLQVTHGIFVDEFADLSRIATRTGPLELHLRGNARPAKEDAHRLGGEAGSSIVYRLPGSIRSCAFYGFFPKGPGPFRCAVGAGENEFTELAGEQTAGSQSAGDYGYWTPVIWRAGPVPPGSRALRIEFGTEAQLGRIEITYAR